MASGVNVKMGVSGVQQFKQGMKESQAAVKNLDQQLKLNEQQLKLNGDAEVYMQNKAELLEKQIEKQREVVRQAEAALSSMKKNGIDQSSKAFQDMQAQSYKAQTDLMAMRTELQNIGEAGDAAEEGVEGANEALRNINKGVSFQNVTSGIEKITGALENVAKWAFKAGKMITQEVLGAGSWADDLATRAKYYGMSTEDLQRAEKTATLIDTSVDTIISAQNKLKKGIGSKNTEVMGTFAALFGEGYDPKSTGWEQSFWDAGEALMKFTDAEQQEVYAQRLFGKSWHELIPLFETGKEAYDELNQSWNVVSEENLQKLTEMDDQYQKLNAEFETFKMTIMSTLADALTPVMETLTNLLKEFNEYLASPEGKEMLEALGQAVEGLFTDLTNIDPEDAVKSLTDVFEKRKGALEWVFDHKQDVVDALKYIVAGWGVLKLTGGALEVLKLLTGLKNLHTFGVGNPQDVSQAGRPGGTYNGTPNASTGLNFWDRLSGFMAAGSFYRATEGRLKEQQRELDRQMEGMTAQEQQDYMLINTLHWTPEQVRAYRLGEQLYNGKAADVDRYGSAGTDDVIHKSRQYNYFDGGEYVERTNRMIDVMDSNTEQQTAANTKAAQAVTDMTSTLPPAIEAAVRRGMSGVTIIVDDRGIGAIGSRVSSMFGAAVAAAIK